MASIVSRILGLAAWTLASPVRWALGTIARWRLGSSAVLLIEVERGEDARTRAARVAEIRRVAAEPEAVAVLLRIKEAPGGWAACADLREALLELREAGKAVYASVDAPGNATMFLASACDRVWITPMGEVGLFGIGIELTFFGAALARLGIRPDFEAAGDYKSAAESYTRSFASPTNQEALGVLATGLHEQLIEALAQGRSLPEATVRLALTKAPLSADEAKELGLVDDLLYGDQIEDWLEEQHGDDMHLVAFDGWARLTRMARFLGRLGQTGPRVAVVHLDGSIVMADSGNRPAIRGRLVAGALRALRKDDEVRAVVLHVNSPGGSAVASDIMWREVELLQRDKPVVAVFADVSASGGYYLSAPAAEIVARPTTLTGSIGVVGGKLVLGEALGRIGVHQQSIGDAPNAGVYSAMRPFTDPQRERFRSHLQRFYDGFVHRVAAGRRVPIPQVEPHCQGRVWLGTHAIERGLVDRLGGLELGIERAVALAGLGADWVRVDQSPMPRRSLASRVLQNAMNSTVSGSTAGRVANLMGLQPGPVLQVVLDHPGEPLAVLPFDITVR